MNLYKEICHGFGFSGMKLINTQKNMVHILYSDYTGPPGLLLLELSAIVPVTKTHKFYKLKFQKQEKKNDSTKYGIDYQEF